MGFFHDILTTLSKGEQKAEKEFELIGNCFGFFGVDGGVGTSTLAYETALLASAQGLRTCFVDASPMSSFAFSKALPNMESVENIPDMSKRFIKRNCPISETMIPVNETLRVLSFGDMELLSTFGMEYNILKDTYEEVKQVFDLVIMDIQNTPYCESTMAALKNCSTVYTICAPTPETITKKARLDNLFSIAGMESCLTNIVFGGVPTGLSVVSALGGSMRGHIIGEYPYVPGFKHANLTQDSVLKACKGPEVRQYSKFLDFILGEIFEGMKGKEAE